MARRKATSPAKLSPELEVELRDRLEDTLDEIDDVADKRRRLSKKLGGHLKVLAETRDLVRRQLKGVDLDQLEIPGTEKPEPHKDPLVAEILRIAGGIVTPGKDGAEVVPLVWRGDPATGIVVAEVPGGEYRIERNEGAREGWTAKWLPTGGRQKLLAVGEPLEACKEQLRLHHLDRAGDELLRGAGADDLAKGPKGPAEAFKKGGRHG